MSNTDFFEQMMGKYTGDKKYDTHGYHCVSCGYELSQVTVQTPAKDTKKLFWCERGSCSRYGTVTVLAKKKAK